MRKIIKNAYLMLLSICMGLMLAACNNDQIGKIQKLLDDNDEKPIDFYERMLDKFCQEHYDNLFKDFWGTRHYVAGSLKVDSVVKVKDKEREVYVYGKHDFNGRHNIHNYDDRDFSANVYETAKHSNEYIITFEKVGKKLISKKEYKETRTKHFYYEEKQN